MGMDDDGSKLLSCIGAMAILFLFNPLLWLFEGWVVVKLWVWYVVPIGVPLITIAQAVGLNLIFAVFHGPKLAKPDEGFEKWYVRLATQVLLPIFALIVGYLFHITLR